MSLNILLILSSDISVVFTSKEHVEDLTKKLEGTNVQVMSFEAAYYIRGVQMREEK